MIFRLAAIPVMLPAAPPQPEAKKPKNRRHGRFCAAQPSSHRKPRMRRHDPILTRRPGNGPGFTDSREVPYRMPP